jgi:hypothetical protein
MRPFQGCDGSSILLAATKVMSTQTIKVEGFEIELASELYCDRGGDHHELVDRAYTDRRVLGHNIDESAVLCVRCMKAIALKARLDGGIGRMA